MKKFLIALGCLVILTGVAVFTYFQIPKPKPTLLEFDMSVKSEIVVGEESKIEWSLNNNDASVSFKTADSTVAKVVNRSEGVFVVGVKFGETTLIATARYEDQKITKQSVIEITNKTNPSNPEKDPQKSTDPQDPTESIDPQDPTEPKDPQNPEDPKDPENPTNPEDTKDPSEEDKQDPAIEEESLFKITSTDCQIEGNVIKMTKLKAKIMLEFKDGTDEKVEIEMASSTGLTVKGSQSARNTYILEAQTAGEYTLKITYKGQEKEYKIVVNC